MENASSTLDNSGCLQLSDKQDASSGTCRHFPHELNEEDDKAKIKMGAQLPK